MAPLRRSTRHHSVVSWAKLLGHRGPRQPKKKGDLTLHLGTLTTGQVAQLAGDCCVKVDRAEVTREMNRVAPPFPPQNVPIPPEEERNQGPASLEENGGSPPPEEINTGGKSQMKNCVFCGKFLEEDGGTPKENPNLCRPCDIVFAELEKLSCGGSGFA